MAKKQMSWKTKGMNRDLSVSAFNPEFAFENRNLRLGTNGANTMMSWVNEKGTASIGLRNIEYWSKQFPNTDYVSIVYEDPNDQTWTHHAANTEDVSINGTPIGTAVINHKLVVFTTDTLHDYDYIYVLNYIDDTKTSMYCKMLFGGENLSLGFSIDHPLETLVSYESEKIQKVYWTDGINQPRVVNIVGKIRKVNNTQFDFVPTLQLLEDVKVRKVLGANGMFAPGVIQYAFTYYTKYGQESNIFYTSPLNYISYRDRGASPEDKVENAFQITVTGVDANFDYLRIYSIQRTSINATPICKRVQDIAIDGLESVDVGGVSKLVASFIDTGTTGDNVDPVELLYKGGEVISAYTMEQKDNTLFLGNLSITRPQIASNIKTHIKGNTLIEQSTRDIIATSVSTGSYVYSNQLTSYDSTGRSVPCGGFKRGDLYRLGIQFQHNSGRWSEPIYIDDEQITNTPVLSNDNTTITLPTLQGTLPAEDVAALAELGYKKARPLVVFPNIQDRKVLCQGIANPTLYTNEHRSDKDLYAQASWFFRASYGRKVSSECTSSPANKEDLPYTHYGIGTNNPATGCSKYNPDDARNNIRLVEVQGDYNDNNKFRIERNVVTLNSPDIEFDSQLSVTDFSTSMFQQVGHAQFDGTLSDIDVQTETPTISNAGAGFDHKSFVDDNTYGIISGLFYDDYIIDESGEGKEIFKDPNEYSACRWMVYLWNKNGSLNNDINRPANLGIQSALLKKKVISNLRYANTFFNDNISETGESYINFPQLFSSNEVSIIKMDDNIYEGNIDTILLPDNSDGNYFAYESDYIHKYSVLPLGLRVTTTFKSHSWWKTFSLDPEDADENGLYKYKANTDWECPSNHGQIGDKYLDLVMKREAVRMKYKSTPHLVFEHLANIDWFDNVAAKANSLPILEILQTPAKPFGGTSTDALRENVWIPCGDPVLLNTNDDVIVEWAYGDTYFQRWDCLKTYAFTPEDINQVVEIGSFFLETRVNIDGRYDRNRGQLNNLNVSPTNFNLLNPIYTQVDNFFQYRIQDNSFYEDTVYHNQITWEKTKNSGADVDIWTNITLASTLELDGDKGSVTSLKRFNDVLLCFQESGLSRILYNENVQIQSTEGAPIELANSGKVQGKKYFSDTIGCYNKWSIVNGTLGLYFMDSDGKDIYLFNGQLTNLSTQQGFNSWCKLHIPSNSLNWTPIFPTNYDQSAFTAYYDRINQEILFINHSMCLAFSEKFGVFTSFYDYHNTPYFCNLDDTGIWLRANQLWKHQAGDYCRFFGAKRPYSMVLVGNPEPQTDKIFTNLEFRACIDGDGSESEGIFTPYLPFDSLDTWNEYQHGIAYLGNRSGHAAMKHHTLDNEASLKRKFRIWRCDIPRDNGNNLDTFDETFDDTFHPLSRTRKHPMDRMRNPWLYLRLRQDEDNSGRRVEVHDIIMTYFD